MNTEQKTNTKGNDIASFAPFKARLSIPVDYQMTVEGWFKEPLLQNLNELSLIIMDNAKYHCVCNNSIPKVGKMQKSKLQSHVLEQNIVFEQADTAAILKERQRITLKRRNIGKW